MRSWVKKGLIGMALIVGFSGPAVAGDPEAGKAVFGQCAACHQVGPNAQSVIGPPLNGIVGAKAGAYPGFAYSPGMKKLGEEGYVWNEEHLDAWLENPKALLPTSMMSLAFQGIKDPTERANIIAYLATIPK
ncbi:MAG: cytochrome c family protein [Methyloceanibacter sp.]